MKAFLAMLVLVLVASVDCAFSQESAVSVPTGEGVCSPLFHQSPGLFGLCHAYCEVLDCDETQDPSNGCPRILENYNRMMNPETDPAMPCLAAPVECPCFTEALVEAIAQKVPTADETWCVNNEFSYYDYRLIQVLIGNPPDEPFQEWEAISGKNHSIENVWCTYRDYTWDGEASSEVLVEWTSGFDAAGLEAYQACVDIMEAVWAAYDLPYGDLTSCD